MEHCVYNTDSTWFENLRRLNPSEPINFWRKDKRVLHLSPGAPFYFRLRGTHFIAGRAKFFEMKLLHLSEAWKEYGVRNGYPTENDFVSNAFNVLNLDTHTPDPEINCIILAEPEWLNESEYVPISDEIFPRNILAHKFFDDNTIKPISERFPLRGNLEALSELEELTQGERIYEEGRIRLSIHTRRERNRILVSAAKKGVPWLCDICGIDFDKIYGTPYIEAHHKQPLESVNISTETKISDLALLCPNCHKAVHRLMIVKSTQSYDLLKDAIQKRLSEKH